MRAIKLKYYLICMIFLFGCVETVKEDTKPTKMSFEEEFSYAINSSFPEADKLNFEKVERIDPNFKEGFYSEYEINQYYYFRAYLNQKSGIDFAILKNGNLNHHEVYYMIDHEGKTYIDFSENILGDFTFLNRFGYKIYQRDIKRNEYHSTVNLWDQRYSKTWVQDSTFVSISKEKISINDKNYNYFKDLNNFYNLPDSNKIFTIIGYGDNNIALEINGRNFFGKRTDVHFN